jgi:hypothetical protein
MPIAVNTLLTWSRMVNNRQKGSMTLTSTHKKKYAKPSRDLRLCRR